MKSLRRFQVLTVGLSPDVKRVHPAFGKIDRGEVSRPQLLTGLELYRQLEPDWAASASHFAIQSDTGRFIVRASGKQLLLTEETTPPTPPVAASAEQIMARLEKQQEISVVPPRAPPEPVWRSLVTLGLICGGVALMVYALRPILLPSPAGPATECALVTDPTEAKNRQDALTGIFATGQRPGDRLLTVSAQGHVVFAELGPRQSLGSGADSFRIGRRDKRTCLITTRSGTIEALDANTLLYYSDTYRRVN